MITWTKYKDGNDFRYLSEDNQFVIHRDKNRHYTLSCGGLRVGYRSTTLRICKEEAEKILLYKQRNESLGSLAIHHKDGNPTNNDLDNLELVEITENRGIPPNPFLARTI
jgi:hypothetical protein